MDVILGFILVLVLTVLVLVPFVIVRNMRRRAEYKRTLKARGVTGRDLKDAMDEFTRNGGRAPRGER